MRQRFFDYFDEFTLAGGSNTTRILQLAGSGMAAFFPFALRSVHMTGAALDGVTWRIRRVDGSYIDSEPIQRLNYCSQSYSVNFWPIFPQEPFPAGGALFTDFYNDNVASEPIKVIYRGVQYVPDGTEPFYTYPERYTETRFDYQQYQTVAKQTSGELENLSLTIGLDADFVMRGVTGAQDVNFDTPSDIRIQFKSQSGVRYSNAPVPFRFIVGQFIPEFVRPFVPELYIPRGGVLWYNITRNDPAGSTAVQGIRFTGAKITEVCR